MTSQPWKQFLASRRAGAGSPRAHDSLVAGPDTLAHHESALPLIIDPWTDEQAGNAWQCGRRRAKIWLAGQHWLAEGVVLSVAAGHLVPGAAVECPASCFGGEPSDLP